MEWCRTKMNKDVIQLLESGYRNAMKALYPNRCPICENIVDNPGKTCELCGQKIKYIVQPFCLKCGKQLDFEEAEYCHDCEKGKHHFTSGVAAFAYTEDLKKSIYRFKYANRREYAAFYGKSLAALKGHIIRNWQPEVLIPVPLHKKRYRKRGFNQAEEIAAELGKELGIPVDNQWLMRKVHTVPQKELDDKGRFQNVKGAFQVTNNVVKYKKIVLVDDIYTTGNTIDACTEVLKKAGAENVYFVTVCIGRGF